MDLITAPRPSVPVRKIHFGHGPEQVGRTDDIEVIFTIPAVAGATSACVVGEFNDWSTTASPLQPSADGLAVSLRLKAGRSHRFRYLLDGERWENDWAADRYDSNEFGGDDSVVDLTGYAVAIELSEVTDAAVDKESRISRKNSRAAAQR